ncbi:hypothetical protein CCR94_10750 [Rhodoblastus sphagnicola]|uniref:TIGR04255 family protein n=1 Tax=Rhodoblastus sphagnicola TaxID=333368 RepID=A0A2S6N8N5_9HYPH|nr:TIGR04255 family protein [Rhodoblastus sphagnicola]MBB4199929.1 uncharacterized protein (TIGR04255 family) [Rhodoblastus sphagnicola]PPQ30951.1 hypothetical protein CCR94_10750 [Rhodoblastus sphagnicola]
MFEDVCYKKSFLTEVVARIDFVSPVAALEKNIPAKAIKKIGLYFPIAEPIESISQHIELGVDGGVKQKEVRGKQWNFFGKQREKQLTIESSAIFVRYTKYRRFEDLKAEFQESIGTIDQAEPGIIAQRFGLRYVNQFEFDDLTISSIGKYFDESIIGSLPFNLYAANITRNFHVVELKFDDIDVRFQFGFPNSDYPAIMRRPMFVIDIDAYAQIIHPISESIQYIESAHERIQELFEKSITESLRSKMNGRK